MTHASKRKGGEAGETTSWGARGGIEACLCMPHVHGHYLWRRVAWGARRVRDVRGARASQSRGSCACGPSRGYCTHSFFLPRFILPQSLPAPLPLTPCPPPSHTLPPSLSHPAPLPLITGRGPRVDPRDRNTQVSGCVLQVFHCSQFVCLVMTSSSQADRPFRSACPTGGRLASALCPEP